MKTMRLSRRRVEVEVEFKAGGPRGKLEEDKASKSENERKERHVEESSACEYLTELKRANA